MDTMLLFIMGAIATILTVIGLFLTVKEMNEGADKFESQNRKGDSR